MNTTVPEPGDGIPITEEAIRFDEASARFLNEHRRERRTITVADYGNPMILKKTHVPDPGLA
jgi:hypothetical protein